MKKETLHLSKVSIVNLITAMDSLDREALEAVKGGSNDDALLTIVPVICA